MHQFFSAPAVGAFLFVRVPVWDAVAHPASYPARISSPLLHLH